MARFLGIESSCDDTGAAVLDSDGNVLSSVVASQIEVHAPYGGVVPELASRHHLRNIRPVVDEALAKASLPPGGITGVAATAGPGLIGSVLVGFSFAKALACGLGVPFIPVNHIEAHLHSPWLEHRDLPYPALVLVVSGGHSHLFLCRDASPPRLVCATRDDAAGEALDKAAKFLGLPYPGGPWIDRLARKGNPRAFPFSLPRMSSGSLDYSFSGLKTALIYGVKRDGLTPPEKPDLERLPQWLYDLLASYQKRVVDHLLQRVRQALQRFSVRSLAMAGGVACNSVLRSRLGELAEKYHLECAYPSPRFCTDNAAMIAFAALKHFGRPQESQLEADAFATHLWKTVDEDAGTNDHAERRVP
ncbi:MAG: tRNA (adenosine(37)-N6)-threonylcarbamoyltransferase complex transferase subunit TsaD [Acidobacteriota bacterium]